MTAVPRPLPRPTPETEGFWAAARRHELVVQRCNDCEALRHYPQPMCPHCHSLAWAWSPLRGQGVVYSYSVCHQAFHPAWADRVPYVVATIELDEGVRMVSDLDDPPEEVAIGRRVEVFFDEMSEEITLPRFRLRRP